MLFEVSKKRELGSKPKFYKFLVLPRLTYGAAESKALTEAQGAQLETFHNGRLRQMMGPHRGLDGPSTAELLARTGQASMADLTRRHRVRWLGHADRKPNDVLIKQLSFAHSVPGHSNLWCAPTSRGRTPPCMTWADTRPHAADRPSTKLGDLSPVPGRMERLSCEQCLI